MIKLRESDWQLCPRNYRQLKAFVREMADIPTNNNVVIPLCCLLLALVGTSDDYNE